MIGRIIKIRILRPRDSKNIQHKLIKLSSEVSESVGEFPTANNQTIWLGKVVPEEKRNGQRIVKVSKSTSFGY